MIARRPLFSVLSEAALTVVSSMSAATFVNFDDQTSPPLPLTNQYAGSGLLFSNITRASSFSFNIIPLSAPNYVSPFFGTSAPGLIEFVDPADSSVDLITNSVTITMVGLATPPGHPGNYSGATIDALDIFGNVIAGQTQVINATSTATSDFDLTFTGELHGLRFTQTAGTTGLLPFDDLRFGPLSSVPEPSTDVLVSGALTGLALICKKRNSAVRFSR